MTTLIAKVKNGRIDVPALPEFPEGSEVSVTLQPALEPLGILHDEDYPTDPESIIDWISTFEEIHNSPGANEAFLEMEKVLAENRSWELSQMEKREYRQGSFES
jgi:hypothetical protein